MIRGVIMRFRRYCTWSLLLLAAGLTFYITYFRNPEPVKIVMGSRLYMQAQADETEEVHHEGKYEEKYFRPSKLPILNTRRIEHDLLWKYQEQEPGSIKVPGAMLKTPEDALLNYFSLLEHAANLKEGSSGGCGTVGNAKLPYPVAYGFLTPQYQKRLHYDKYLESFEGIGHINLIKLKRVPEEKDNPRYLRYFIELETIEGSSKGLTYFAYYYGFAYLAQEGAGYRISDMKLWGEDFLCAPYHGWYHDAEANVNIRYGGWCKLVKERHPTKVEGFVKDIYFSGTDGMEYMIRFFSLPMGWILKLPNT